MASYLGFDWAKIGAAAKSATIVSKPLSLKLPRCSCCGQIIRRKPVAGRIPGGVIGGLKNISKAAKLRIPSKRIISKSRLITSLQGIY